MKTYFVLFVNSKVWYSYNQYGTYDYARRGTGPMVNPVPSAHWFNVI